MLIGRKEKESRSSIYWKK